MSKNDPIVVLGGGVAGLIASLLLQESLGSRDITVIEASPQVGGALVGCKAMQKNFDLGTHIPQETGISAIDDLFQQAIGEARLLRMPSHIGDCAGTLVDGHLFDQSSYFNLSWLQPDIATNVVAHTISRTSEVDEFQTPATRFLAVEDVAKRWFGNVSSHDFLLPLLRRFFGSESELSGFALELLNLTRLHVADRATWQLHSHNDNFRARVAFPDQRNLPMALRHTRKSLYPVGGSTADFVEGFRRLLRERGIRLLESTSIQEIRREKNEVDIHADGVATTIKFQKCFSTLGPSVTLRLMGLSKPSVIRRVSSRFVHHLVSRPTTSDVCYAYEMSSENPVFRVTNYRAFSGQSDDCRLTTEIISPNQLSDTDAIQAAELALRSSDLLGGGQVTRSAVLSTAVGFPVPTVAVFDQFYDDSEQIEMLEDESFLVTGVGAKGNVYFQNEILRHLFGQVSRW